MPAFDLLLNLEQQRERFRLRKLLGIQACRLGSYLLRARAALETRQDVLQSRFELDIRLQAGLLVKFDKQVFNLWVVNLQ